MPLTLPSLWGAAGPRGGLGLRRHGGACLVGVDQAVLVAVEAVELVARAQELAAGDVAVVVAVHLLKPVRTDRGAGGLGRDHRSRRGSDHAFTCQTGEPTAGDR